MADSLMLDVVEYCIKIPDCDPPDSAEFISKYNNYFPVKHIELPSFSPNVENLGNITGMHKNQKCNPINVSFYDELWPDIMKQVGVEINVKKKIEIIRLGREDSDNAQPVWEFKIEGWSLNGFCPNLQITMQAYLGKHFKSEGGSVPDGFDQRTQKRTT